MRGGRRSGAGRPPSKWQTSQFQREDIRILARIQGFHPGLDMAWVGILPVKLDWMNCRFGGFRPWFLCPECERRCAVLYLIREQPKCVRCGDLSYPSQSLDKFDRSWLRTRKIEAKLGGADYMTEALFKPKWMQWDTFSGMWLALKREQAYRDEIFIGWGKKYFGIE